MTTYLGINLGLAAVVVFTRATLLAARHRGLTIAFRTQLILSRALLGVTCVTTAGAIAFVHYQGLTWSVGDELLAHAQSSLVDSASFDFEAAIACAGLLIVVALYKTLRAMRSYRDLAMVLRNSVLLRRHGRVAIVASDRVDVPCSVRTLRACWVVLPNHLLANRGDVRFAVSHELQHHRHGDTAWAWCAHALTILAWPNPVIHLWRRWHAKMQELACDEALLARPGFEVADYARCLLNVAERALCERHAFAPSMASTSQLEQRIEMLFASRERRASSTFIAAALACALVIGVSVSGFAAGWTTTPVRIDEEPPAAFEQEHGEIPCEDSLTELECR